MRFRKSQSNSGSVAFGFRWRKKRQKKVWWAGGIFSICLETRQR